MEVVTVIELLSPSNKCPGSVGRRKYLEKREKVLESSAHLVELDLLRGGARAPLIGERPPGEYSAVVSRSERRPRAEVYPWSLRQALPSIPVPLERDEPDVQLDLQVVFRTVYENARYDRSIDYGRKIDPPLSAHDEAWVSALLDRES